MRSLPKTLIKVALGALILYTIALKLDFRDVLHTLLSVNAYAILAAVIIALMQPLFAAARLSAATALYHRHLPFGESLRTTYEGLFFGQTFISFLGSDALRIWRIRQYSTPLRDAVSIVAFDRLLGIIVNHLAVLASLPWLLTHITDTTVRFGLMGLALAGFLGIVAVILLAIVPERLGLFRKLPPSIQSNRTVQGVLHVSGVGRHLLQPNRQLLIATTMSALTTIANAGIFCVLLLGWGVPLPVALGCGLLAPAMLEIAMLPISVAGWGVREGAAIVAFGALGVSAEIAFNSSIVFGLTMLAVSLSGGVLWMLDRNQMELKSLVVPGEPLLTEMALDEQAAGSARERR